jgi:hypothetical protein
VADWVTGDDVAQRLETLGRTTIDSPRLDISAHAACQLVRRRRSLTDDNGLGADPAVIEGTVRWACLLFQAPAQPSGFGSYEESGSSGEYGDTISEIYRLVGVDQVVA